jgi:hypothetical protein
MPSMTFKLIERSKPTEYVGTCDCTTTETVHESGHVDGHSVGIWDGASIDRRYSREHGKIVDMRVVKAARIKQGWSVERVER